MKIAEAMQKHRARKPKNPFEAQDRKARKVLLAKGRLSLIELANNLNCAPRLAEDSVRRLHEAKYNVHLKQESVRLDRVIEEGARLVVNSRDFFDGRWYKFGLVSDTHLYSKYARLDVLNCLYDIFSREKIRVVWHAGNPVEGECKFNKFDLVGPAGFEAAAEYFARNYPQRNDGIVTRFITGDDHEGWWINREGINIGARLQQTAEELGRKDLQWIGHMEADVFLKAPKGQAWMKIMHCGGGTAYAISYIVQKIVESFQGGEKPHILLVGHPHKFDHGYPREIHTVQAGCVQDQTPFMRKLKLQAHVGGCIISFHQAVTGEINRFRAEWIPYYDRGFYEKGNKYRRW
jgi:hypothetical protein